MTMWEYKRMIDFENKTNGKTEKLKPPTSDEVAEFNKLKESGVWRSAN